MESLRPCSSHPREGLKILYGQGFEKIESSTYRRASVWGQAVDAIDDTEDELASPP